MTLSETLITVTNLGDYYISLRKNKPLLLIINVLATNEDYDFSISSFDKNGDFLILYLISKIGKDNMMVQ